MEAVISILCAVAGLVVLLAFIWDFCNIACSGTAKNKGLLKTGIKLVLALLLLHFHFEMDIFN